MLENKSNTIITHNQPLQKVVEKVTTNKVVDKMDLHFGEHKHVLVQEKISIAVNSKVKY